MRPEYGNRIFLRQLASSDIQLSSRVSGEFAWKISLNVTTGVYAEFKSADLVDNVGAITISGDVSSNKYVRGVSVLTDSCGSPARSLARSRASYAPCNCELVRTSARHYTLLHAVALCQLQKRMRTLARYVTRTCVHSSCMRSSAHDIVLHVYGRVVLHVYTVTCGIGSNCNCILRSCATVRPR